MKQCNLIPKGKTNQPYYFASSYFKFFSSNSSSGINMVTRYGLQKSKTAGWFPKGAEPIYGSDGK